MNGAQRLFLGDYEVRSENVRDSSAALEVISAVHCRCVWRRLVSEKLDAFGNDSYNASQYSVKSSVRPEMCVEKSVA